MVLGWISGFVVLVFCLLILALLGFHVYLIGSGQSTYDYFISKKKMQVIPVRSDSFEKSENTLPLENTTRLDGDHILDGLNLNSKTDNHILFGKS
jgi:hypothetical protein